jgi:multidrug efflux pump subunit AcrA (membrane-fusion protein)
MTPPIFRQEALERLASPEQLDQLLHVTSPRGWVALGTLGLLLVAALVWGFCGTVSSTVQGRGVLRRDGGPVRVEAPAAGVIRRGKFRLGDVVAKGEVLVVLTADVAGKPLPVRSPVTARILGGFGTDSKRVKKGELLGLLDPQNQPMRAVLYVPVDQGYQVEGGMRVDLSPAPARKSEFGYLRGRVLSAAKVPSDREDMSQILGNEVLVRQLAAAGPSLQVVVELTPAATSSGYLWTSAEGWPVELHSGIPCQAFITVGEQRPVELVLPALQRLLGS